MYVCTICVPCMSVIFDVGGSYLLIRIYPRNQWRIQGGVGGGSNPPPMTGRTKIFRIELKNGLFSSLCYICSIVGTVAFDKYY